MKQQLVVSSNDASYKNTLIVAVCSSYLSDSVETNKPNSTGVPREPAGKEVYIQLTDQANQNNSPSSPSLAPSWIIIPPPTASSGWKALKQQLKSERFQKHTVLATLAMY